MYINVNSLSWKFKQNFSLFMIKKNYQLVTDQKVLLMLCTHENFKVFAFSKFYIWNVKIKMFASLDYHRKYFMEIGKISVIMFF